MNIELETGISIIGALCSVAMAYGIAEGRSREMLKQITQINGWKEKHVEWADESKSVLNQDIYEVKTLTLIQGEQYKEIIRRLDTIDKKMDVLERRHTQR